MPRFVFNFPREDEAKDDEGRIESRLLRELKRRVEARVDGAFALRAGGFDEDEEGYGTRRDEGCRRLELSRSLRACAVGLTLTSPNLASTLAFSALASASHPIL